LLTPMNTAHPNPDGRSMTVSRLTNGRAIQVGLARRSSPRRRFDLDQYPGMAMAHSHHRRYVSDVVTEAMKVDFLAKAIR
jgi:hypothetical protein